MKRAFAFSGVAVAELLRRFAGDVLEYLGEIALILEAAGSGDFGQPHLGHGQQTLALLHAHIVQKARERHAGFLLEDAA